MSVHEAKMFNLQRQMRENQTDLRDFIQDLDEWESDIKKKETDLKSTKGKDQILPPVRNSLTKKKRKKKTKNEEPKENGTSPDNTSKRISGYDYRAWDKFDVDKALNSGEDEEDSSETDEEWEDERQRQAAIMEKDMGNQYFKEGKYELAIECYSKGVQLDPENPLLPANRAMALLKLDRYGAAEVDCTTALTFDPTYVKAYLRRGAARMGLEAVDKAKSDFQKALQLEPQNSLAKKELKTIERILLKNKEESIALKGETGCIRPIRKDAKLRSKKPMRRIEVEEIGVDEDEVKRAIRQTEATQGATKRLITEQDSKVFERFTQPNTEESKEVNEKSEEPRIPLIEDLTENSQSDNFKTDNADFFSAVKSELMENASEKTDIAEEQDNEPVSAKELEKAKLAKLYSPPISPRTSPRIPGVPINSFQFQTDWKIIKDNTEAVYQYFTKISPENYNKLFGQALEADILMKLILVFKDFYLPNNDPLFSPLCHLTMVKRFDMIVMFLSSKEKKVLMELFEKLEGKVSQTELVELKRSYGCR